MNFQKILQKKELFQKLKLYSFYNATTTTTTTNNNNNKRNHFILLLLLLLFLFKLW